jgi:hypothetical protein
VGDERKTEELLGQILQVQRQHLEEYKRVTSRSLEMQREGVETQARHVRMYRRFIIAGSIVIGILAIYLFWLSAQLP